LLEHMRRAVLREELRVEPTDLDLAELRAVERLPLAEPAAAVLTFVPEERVVLVDLAVAVEIGMLAVVPDLVAVPDGAEVEVAEVRPVAEERVRARGLAGHRIPRDARRVGLVDIAGPGVPGDRHADAVETLVIPQILGVHAVAA